jgi:hypothetical protein
VSSKSNFESASLWISPPGLRFEGDLDRALKIEACVGFPLENGLDSVIWTVFCPHFLAARKARFWNILKGNPPSEFNLARSLYFSLREKSPGISVAHGATTVNSGRSPNPGVSPRIMGPRDSAAETPQEAVAVDSHPQDVFSFVTALKLFSNEWIDLLNSK